ncbi:PREDICTED: pentatricopeptide repeat-containing protein At4g02750 [Theobroma cacao]|uniref:Pentatricopeptide repeat-containing protein At4g02750 n=1 Tax=Theobroma cacao TaxID=3641 RepID=A0AB32WDT7_THECC|nr:PREDICTED: pentatricopeptide repeat-containing protein At4g02750 [Theobroma cacao]
MFIPKLTLTLPIILARHLSLSAPTFFKANQTSTTVSNLKPHNSKISKFMKNGLIHEAQNLFGKMPHKNVVTWNTMIRGYFLNGFLSKALALFHQTPERDIFTYNTVISGLMHGGDVDGARGVFEGMACRDVVTWNAMLGGYFMNGMLEEGLKVFEEMPGKNVITWNLVIEGLVKCEKFDLAEEYFKRMSYRDVASWTVMISGLAKAGRMAEACKLFEEMPVKDVRAWNVMLDGFVGFECVDKAEILFQEMPEKDLDSWKLLLSGLVTSRRLVDALRYFMEMPMKCCKTLNSILLGLIRNGLVKEAHAFLEKQPYNDVVSWTNVIVGYFEIGEVRSAIKVFKLMPIQDVTVWNAMICGLGETDYGEEGFKIFIRMKESGFSSDEATFTSILTISSNLPSLDLGKQSHAQVVKSGLNNFTAVSNALVTMYERCGDLHSALREFFNMPSHDVISWNSIICGFAHHGNAEKALKMFELMRLTDIKPNQITFIGVLSACSHAGLVDQGKYYFDYMKNKCSLEPTTEHYTCIVDLLGRFGLIDEAMSFLNQMRADGIEVPASVWGALLGACRIHHNIKVGVIAAERVLEIEPHNSGVYLILAEMYLSCGRGEDAESIRARMEEKGVRKQHGCSWVEANNSG